MTKYTKQDCLNAVKEVNEQIDGKITIEKYKNHKNSNQPSYQVINKRIGWDNAKNELNISKHRYTKQDCVNAIQELNKKTDESITIQEYRKYKKDNHPCIDTIRDICGSWNKAKVMCGLDINIKNKNLRHIIKQQIKNSIDEDNS